MIVAQVQAQTNLITQGAMDLAMNSGYDLANAAIRFEEVKVSVPAGQVLSEARLLILRESRSGRG